MYWALLAHWQNPKLSLQAPLQDPWNGTCSSLTKWVVHTLFPSDLQLHFWTMFAPKALLPASDRYKNNQDTWSATPSKLLPSPKTVKLHFASIFNQWLGLLLFLQLTCVIMTDKETKLLELESINCLINKTVIKTLTN